MVECILGRVNTWQTDFAKYRSFARNFAANKLCAKLTTLLTDIWTQHKYEGFKVIYQLFCDIAMLIDSFLHKNVKYITRHKKLHIFKKILKNHRTVVES
jgi:hypothetical protein